jgi:hypothetical protein
LLKRLGPDDWSYETVAESDDGYYGNDGRTYTGGSSHLVFDSDNTSHWGGQNMLNAGNIRYGVYEGGIWDFTTIYRQPLPVAFYDATEILGMSFVVSDKTDSIRIIGQEIVVTGEGQYTCELLDFAIAGSPVDVEDGPAITVPVSYQLFQNSPNPFNPSTSIRFDVSHRSRVTLSIYNLRGQMVNTLVDDELPAGSHSIHWDGTNNPGERVPSGTYFYRLRAGNSIETKKMLLLR